jgi:lysozyme family protein
MQEKMIKKNIYSKKFLAAFDGLMHLEGGYCNDSKDSGGETKFGICKRQYPNLDVKNITLNDAKKIYHNDYWNGYRYNQIKSTQVASKIFHNTVNMGPKQSHIILQRALHAVECCEVVEDGIFGPKTLDATNKANKSALIAAIRSESAGFYRILVSQKPSQNKFIRGWLKRAYK